MDKVLRLLFPRGYLWKIIGDGSQVIHALSLSLDRAKDEIDRVRLEAIPATAVDTLPEWHADLGIQYDPTVPVEVQQRRLAALITAKDGCTLGGLQVQLEKEYTGLTITESAGSFSITGTVATLEDAMRVGAIIARHAPLHLVPTIFGYTAPTEGNENPVPPSAEDLDGSIESLADEAVCGVAVCGLTTCGLSA